MIEIGFEILEGIRELGGVGFSGFWGVVLGVLGCGFEGWGLRNLGWEPGSRGVGCVGF